MSLTCFSVGSCDITYAVHYTLHYITLQYITLQKKFLKIIITNTYIPIPTVYSN